MAKSAAVSCRRDRDRQDPILEISGVCDAHSCEVRSRAEAIGVSNPGFKKDRDRFADLFVVKGESLGSVKSQKKIDSFLHRRRRDPLLQAHCSRPRARGVRKYVEIGKWKIGGDSQRILKRVLTLPGKSYQEISPKAEVGNGYESPFDQFDIALDRMASIHGLQNLIVPALQGDVKIGTEFLRRGDQIKQFFADRCGFD